MHTDNYLLKICVCFLTQYRAPWTYLEPEKNGWQRLTFYFNPFNASRWESGWLFILMM